MLAAIRPRQWPKNLLVFGAPIAAGVIFEAHVLSRALFAFAVFTLAASGTYLLNDALDAELDRLHPSKRLRPVAAGLIPIRSAVLLGAGFMFLALLAAAALREVAFMASVLGYVALTTSYSLWLKKVAVVDLVAVAMGFVIRAVAGGFATDVPLSEWFLTVSFFGALFVVAGKRYGEHQQMGDDGSLHRVTLAAYTTSYHQHVMTLASGVTLMSYGLWAYQHGQPSQPWFLASFLPLAMVLLRYSLLVHAGASEEPVELVWSDRPIRLLVVAWIGLAFIGIYLA